MQGYDFHEMIMTMKSISSGANRVNLSAIKDELNKFFSDAKCLEVIYTNNTDKMFFGMSVLPVLPHNYLLDTYNGKIKTFDRYYIEFDSKLFGRQLNLSAKELTAILLHEVGHVVQNSQVSADLSEVINVVVTQDGIKLDRNELGRATGFMELGVKRAIRKITSIFHKQDKEYIADAFVVQCGFGEHLESAFDKIIKSRDGLASLQGNKYKITTLLWCMSLHKDLGRRKRLLKDELQDQKDFEGSELMKRTFDKAIKNVKGTREIIDVVNEGVLDTIKYSDIRVYDKELYEYEIRIANIDNENEAISLIREVNFRIQLMEDYLESDNRSDEKRVRQLIAKYEVIRDKIIQTPKFQDKMYGLFVKHPEIKSRYGSRL